MLLQPCSFEGPALIQQALHLFCLQYSNRPEKVSLRPYFYFLWGKHHYSGALLPPNKFACLVSLFIERHSILSYAVTTHIQAKEEKMGKGRSRGSSGGQRGSQGGRNRTGQSNPNWPSTTGRPSGGGRGNNPPREK